MSELPLVLYHGNCWDGFCAAWIARKALGQIEAVPMQYGQVPPDVDGRVVYMLDFSFPRAVMERMAVNTQQLLVLDHHKTAAEELDGLHHPEGRFEVWFDMTKSGGRLAWEWFTAMGYDLHTPNLSGRFEHYVSAQCSCGQYYLSNLRAGNTTRCIVCQRKWLRDNPSTYQPRAPWLVDYTEDRDLWRHALEGTQEINAALRSYPLDFELWDQFEQKDPRSTFYYEGAAIRRAERQIVESHVRNAREQDVAGHRVLAVNATVLFSEIAGELAKGRPFGACYFDRQDGKRQWSLRSDDAGVDVSVIAKTQGGGGHPHAAGFEEIL